MSDQSRFIHRVWLGEDAPTSFYVLGEIWAENHPDYKVINWDSSVLEEFPDLRPVLDKLKNQPEKMATYVGIALVDLWGGWYVEPEFPSAALPEHLDGAYVSNSGMFGASAPGDEFWHSLLSELNSGYKEILTSVAPSNIIVTHLQGKHS